MAVESNLLLLMIITTFKAAVIAYIGTRLFLRWGKQEKKYKSDFPYLMSLLFFIYAATKLFDVYMYYYTVQNNIIIAEVYNSQDYATIWLARFRFMLSPAMNIPYMILMMNIWFPDKKKLRISIISAWFGLAIILTFVIRTYSTLLLIQALFVLVPIGFSIVTFFILHINKRMKEINCLLLGIGWTIFVILQLIRPIFQGIEPGSELIPALIPAIAAEPTFGQVWVAEVLDLIAVIIIGMGFSRKASYADK